MMAAASGIGFWGEPTSTVDWCEANYYVTRYVAEFMNSATSLLLVLAGLLPVMWHRPLWRHMEARYALGFASVCAVGAGSVAFHGTLQFRHQMWDEVPMLWTVATYAYCLLEHHTAKPSWGVALPAALVLYAVLSTAATSLQGGNNQWFSFHAAFACLEFPVLYLVLQFFRNLGDDDADTRRVLRRGFHGWFLAIAVWILDLNLCPFLRRFPAYDLWNLHAWGWHVLTSWGLYSMSVGMWYHRLRRVLGVDVRLVSGVLPRIAAVGGKTHAS